MNGYIRWNELETGNTWFNHLMSLFESFAHSGINFLPFGGEKPIELFISVRDVYRYKAKFTIILSQDFLK